MISTPPYQNLTLRLCGALHRVFRDWIEEWKKWKISGVSVFCFFQLFLSLSFQNSFYAPLWSALTSFQKMRWGWGGVKIWWRFVFFSRSLSSQTSFCASVAHCDQFSGNEVGVGGVKNWWRFVFFSLSIFRAKISLYATVEHCDEFSGNEVGSGGSEKLVAFRFSCSPFFLFLPLSFQTSFYASVEHRDEFSENEVRRWKSGGAPVLRFLSLFPSFSLPKFRFTPLRSTVANFQGMIWGVGGVKNRWRFQFSLFFPPSFFPNFILRRWGAPRRNFNFQKMNWKKTTTTTEQWRHPWCFQFSFLVFFIVFSFFLCASFSLTISYSLPLCGNTLTKSPKIWMKW